MQTLALELASAKERGGLLSDAAPAPRAPPQPVSGAPPASPVTHDPSVMLVAWSSWLGHAVTRFCLSPPRACAVQMDVQGTIEYAAGKLEDFRQSLELKVR